MLVLELLLQVPEWTEPSWASLMEACWEVNPASRPNLRDLAAQLEAILSMR